MNNPKEPHTSALNSKLNSLRAAVLGANDGIVSIAGIIMGVAGASAEKSAILTAGIAGLTAGALAMAAGEYVSVSSQRDTEEALLNKERSELKREVKKERLELEQIYQAKGLKAATAKQVAKELSEHDVFRAHVEAELGFDPDELTNAWHAAGASAMAFVVGSLVPVLSVLLAPSRFRVQFVVYAVIIALGITGFLSAKFSGAKPVKTIARVIAGGMLAMGITFIIGKIFGAVVA